MDKIITVAILHSMLLWLLPKKKLSYETANYLGIALSAVFLIIYSLFTGNGHEWLVFGNYLAYRLIRLKDLPRKKGIDWVGISIIILGMGIFSYAYIFAKQKFR